MGTALMFAQRFLETPTVFVYIILMQTAGFVCDRLMLRLRGRLCASWRMTCIQVAYR